MQAVAKYDDATHEWLEKQTIMNILRRNPRKWSGSQRKLLMERGLIRRIYNGPNARFELTEWTPAQGRSTRGPDVISHAWGTKPHER